MLDKSVIKDFLYDNLLEIKEDPEYYQLDQMAKDFSNYIMDDYYDWIKDNYHSFGEGGFEKYLKENCQSSQEIRNLFLRHKNIFLFNNDVLNEKLFENPFIDLIVTSPPYNVGIEYNSNDDELDYEQYLEFSEK